MMLLIDADVTCYGAAEHAETEIRWDEDTFSIYGDLEKAKKSFKHRLETYQQLTGIEEFKLTFTHGTNFRKALNPDYKGGRKRKPVGYGALKEWAIETYPSFMKDGLEADDCLGILATKFAGRTVIVTVDKDLLTIPGKMFRLNARGDAGEWHETTEQEGWFRFLSQAISGDKTDGYDGIEGMGKVKADALLKKHGAVWKTVEDAYLKAGMTADDALLNARMARILHERDWDAENNKPILWSPQ